MSANAFHETTMICKICSATRSNAIDLLIPSNYVNLERKRGHDWTCPECLGDGLLTLSGDDVTAFNQR
jgi:hypothetical protein